jgi:hypothetical protein
VAVLGRGLVGAGEAPLEVFAAEALSFLLAFASLHLSFILSWASLFIATADGSSGTTLVAPEMDMEGTWPDANS